eukprot:gene9806-426_t
MSILRGTKSAKNLEMCDFVGLVVGRHQGIVQMYKIDEDATAAEDTDDVLGWCPLGDYFCFPPKDVVGVADIKVTSVEHAPKPIVSKPWTPPANWPTPNYQVEAPTEIIEIRSRIQDTCMHIKHQFRMTNGEMDSLGQLLRKMVDPKLIFSAAAAKHQTENYLPLVEATDGLAHKVQRLLDLSVKTYQSHSLGKTIPDPVNLSMAIFYDGYTPKRTGGRRRQHLRFWLLDPFRHCYCEGHSLSAVWRDLPVECPYNRLGEVDHVATVSFRLGDHKVRVLPRFACVDHAASTADFRGIGGDIRSVFFGSEISNFPGDLWSLDRLTAQQLSEHFPSSFIKGQYPIKFYYLCPVLHDWKGCVCLVLRVVGCSLEEEDRRLLHSLLPGKKYLSDTTNKEIFKRFEKEALAFTGRECTNIICTLASSEGQNLPQWVRILVTSLDNLRWMRYRRRYPWFQGHECRVRGLLYTAVVLKILTDHDPNSVKNAYFQSLSCWWDECEISHGVGALVIDEMGERCLGERNRLRGVTVEHFEQLQEMNDTYGLARDSLAGCTCKRMHSLLGTEPPSRLPTTITGCCITLTPFFLAFLKKIVKDNLQCDGLFVDIRRGLFKMVGAKGDVHVCVCHRKCTDDHAEWSSFESAHITHLEAKLHLVAHVKKGKRKRDDKFICVQQHPVDMCSCATIIICDGCNYQHSKYEAHFRCSECAKDFCEACISIA